MSKCRKQRREFVVWKKPSCNSPVTLCLIQLLKWRPSKGFLFTVFHCGSNYIYTTAARCTMFAKFRSSKHDNTFKFPVCHKWAACGMCGLFESHWTPDKLCECVCLLGHLDESSNVLWCSPIIPINLIWSQTFLPLASLSRDSCHGHREQPWLSVRERFCGVAGFRLQRIDKCSSADSLLLAAVIWQGLLHYWWTWGRH